MNNEKIRSILESTTDVAVRKACLTLLGRRGGSPEDAMATLRRSGCIEGAVEVTVSRELDKREEQLQQDARRQEQLQEAEATGATIVFGYRKDGRTVEELRRVKGVRIEGNNIVCEDLVRQAPRSFRIDRIGLVSLVEDGVAGRLQEAVDNGTKAQIIAAAEGLDLGMDAKMPKAELIRRAQEWLDSVPF